MVNNNVNAAAADDDDDDDTGRKEYKVGKSLKLNLQS